MAKGGHARSARTGRYVTRATAARHPRTTVVESGASAAPAPDTAPRSPVAT
jgi:hypothetical protein